MERVTPFSHRLQGGHPDDWQAVVEHRFVAGLFDGTLPDPVLARYLVQDYQFFDPFLRLLGEAVATAPTTTARLRLARQLGMLATDENDYFQRAFDVLGVPETDRKHPPLAPETRDLVEVMETAIDAHSWPRTITVLAVLEWIYLDWAEAPGRMPTSRRPEHVDWIDLHRDEEFRDWVRFLRAEVDAAEPADAEEARRCAELFGRTVRGEVAFFEAAYRARG